MCLVVETAALYEKVTKPLIDKEKDVRWYLNALAGKSEAEFNVARTEEFVVSPADKKLMGEDPKKSDYLVMFFDLSLRTLRDLRGGDVDLLMRAKNAVLDEAARRWGWTEFDVRFYFHYTPSVHHLHLHCTHIEIDDPSARLGRAHLLDEVVSNLTLNPLHYAQCALVLAGPERDPWVRALRAATPPREVGPSQAPLAVGASTSARAVEERIRQSSAAV